MDERKTKPLRKDTDSLIQNLSSSAKSRWAGCCQCFLSFNAVATAWSCKHHLPPRAVAPREPREGVQPDYAEYTLVVDHFHILAMVFTISILISKSSIRQIFLVLSHTLFVEIQIPLRQEKKDGIMGSF